MMVSVPETRRWTNTDQDRLIACRDHVLAALTREMGNRANCRDLSWVDRERAAVAIAANEWAAAHFPGRGAQTITVEDVERIEVQAVGHVDYARKLALYVAKAVCIP